MVRNATCFKYFFMAMINCCLFLVTFIIYFKSSFSEDISVPSLLLFVAIASSIDEISAFIMATFFA